MNGVESSLYSFSTNRDCLLPESEKPQKRPLWPWTVSLVGGGLGWFVFFAVVGLNGLPIFGQVLTVVALAIWFFGTVYKIKNADDGLPNRNLQVSYPKFPPEALRKMDQDLLRDRILQENSILIARISAVRKSLVSSKEGL